MKELTDRIAALAARDCAKKQAEVVEQQQRAAKREERRVAIRSAMPEVAAVVDALRGRFGEVVVLRAEEGGQCFVVRDRLRALGLNDEQ